MAGGNPAAFSASRKRTQDGSFLSAEVTTYRSDKYSPDSRKPQVDPAGSLETDLSRRDFTVNCMAVRLPDVVFVDPFGGALDLGRKITPLLNKQLVCWSKIIIVVAKFCPCMVYIFECIFFHY